MKNARIAGVGHYLPERVVTNFELEKLMDTSDEWIQERTGIQTRRWISENDSTYEMAYQAAQMALQRANMKAEDIECIILACVISDYIFPGAGCFLQARLGLPGIPAIDIRNACSGFLYALAIADKFIKTETYKTILVVGSEVQSTALDLSSRGRDIAVIFADGAGTAVLTATDDPHKGILTTHLHADGRYADKLFGANPLPPTLNPRIREHIPLKERVNVAMEGRYVFKHAVANFPAVINEALEAAGFTKDDLDLVIPHQANLRITQAVTAHLGIPEEKVVSNIQKYGNTTAASIPIAMSEAWEQGKIRKNSLVCLAAFGAGFTWASALVRF